MEKAVDLYFSSLVGSWGKSTVLMKPRSKVGAPGGPVSLAALAGLRLEAQPGSLACMCILLDENNGLLAQNCLWHPTKKNHQCWYLLVCSMLSWSHGAVPKAGVVKVLYAVDRDSYKACILSHHG